MTAPITMPTPSPLRIAVIPFRAMLADIDGNAEKMMAILKSESQQKTDLVIFPELSLSGYYARDLYYQIPFLDKHDEALEKIIKASGDKNMPACIMGAVMREGGKIYNSALFIDGGKIIGRHDKFHLPQNDIFDEARYFTPANQHDKNFATPMNWRGVKWGVMVCEELWHEEIPALLKKNGAEVMVVINASPFEKNKSAQRLELVLSNVEQHELPIIYNNMLAGLDEVVLDGHNIVVDGFGDMVANQWFKQEPIYVTWQDKKYQAVYQGVDNDDTLACYESQYAAAIDLALRDYVAHHGFKKVMVGVSGGVDSALTLAIAVFALGKERVMAYFLPTAYSSTESKEDAEALCQQFGVPLQTIEIEALYRLGLATLQIAEKNNGKVSITAQNLQARMRGMILMAMSNEHGALLLTTGNKSELAAGYFTLYGDACGGFNPMKDLYKKDVYRLARWFNQHRAEKIPNRILEKEPTAELSPGQKDSDSLLPYTQLDGLLENIIENFGRGLEQDGDKVSGKKMDAPQSKQVEKLLRQTEYKRRQAAPGPKLTTRAFGNGWRLPLAGKY